MQTPHPLYRKQHKEKETCIFHLALPGLLPPEQTLVLDLDARTLSLLTAGPILILTKQFSVNELCVIVPLLDFYPHYCPYEVLLAYISSNVVTSASIEYCRQRLQAALDQGTWLQELRPIRRALSAVRNKLKPFNLGISTVRERGCSLLSLAAVSQAELSNLHPK